MKHCATHENEAPADAAIEYERKAFWDPVPNSFIVTCANWDSVESWANEWVLETSIVKSRAGPFEESQTGDVKDKRAAIRMLEVIASGLNPRKPPLSHTNSVLSPANLDVVLAKPDQGQRCSRRSFASVYRSPVSDEQGYKDEYQSLPSYDTSNTVNACGCLFVLPLNCENRAGTEYPAISFEAID